MTQDLHSEKPTIAIVLFIPHIDDMMEKAKDNGFSQKDVLDWIGVSIDEMLLISFLRFKEVEQRVKRLDNLLRDYEQILFQRSLSGITLLDRNLALLDVVLMKDKSIRLNMNPEGLLLNEQVTSITDRTRAHSRGSYNPISTLWTFHRGVSQVKGIP